MTQLPILWTFRRCPYAMRARLALRLSGVCVEQREILLRDKPAAFLHVSPSGTVPCLQLPDGVIDESFDIMLWALQTRDPLHLLDMPDEGYALITHNDGAFKQALDRTKYASRYPDADPKAQRDIASLTLRSYEARLQNTQHLMTDTPSLADYAILPFVRQFANIDRQWFEAQDWPHVIAWLDRFLASDAFAQIMVKRPLWQP